MHLPPAGLTRTEFTAGLIIKIVAGLVYGYVFLHFYQGDDTWRHHNSTLAETALLLNDPAAFFKNEYTPLHSIAISHSAFEAAMLYVNDLQYALLIKTFAFVNLVTQGNYYLNSIVFNILTFAGHYWLFLVLTKYYPANRFLYFLCCFLFLPSVFWLSGFRIDGLVFLFFTLFLYSLVTLNGWKKAVNMIVAFVGLFICRPENALLLVPAVLGYAWGIKQKRPVFAFVAIYIIMAFIFFVTAFIFPNGGLPGIVAAKQNQFLELHGTRFHLGNLTAGVSSYLHVLPQAFQNTFLRPLVWEAKGPLQVTAALAMIVFWGLVLMFILLRDKAWKKRISHPVILLMLFYGVSVTLSVGYLVPFPGAIIRYKAGSELILLCAVATIAGNKRITKINI